MKDATGKLVNRIKANTKKGFHRVAWDMHYPSLSPVSFKKPKGYQPPWSLPPKGPLALPGEYTVTLMKRQFGKMEALAQTQTFTLKPLNNSPEITKDRPELPLQFSNVQEACTALYRAL